MKKLPLLICCFLTFILLTSCGNERAIIDEIMNSNGESDSSAVSSETGDTPTEPEAEPEPAFDTSLIGRTFISGDYEYTVQEDGTVFISSYSGETQNLTIPTELEDYKVTGIGDNAFMGCDALTSVIVPGQIKSIGKEAFSGCPNLTRVILEEGVESIGASCFEGSVVELNVPESVYKIGQYAIPNDDTLGEDKNGLLYIGNVVVGFSDNFDGHITFDKNTKGIADFALSEQYVKDSQWSAGYYLSISDDTVEFPDGMLYIGTGAFVDQAGIDNFVIPSSVLEIGAHAMYYREDWGSYELFNFIDTAKIYGATGSVAEQYAEMNGISFVTITE